MEVMAVGFWTAKCTGKAAQRGCACSEVHNLNCLEGLAAQHKAYYTTLHVCTVGWFVGTSGQMIQTSLV